MTPRRGVLIIVLMIAELAMGVIIGLGLATPDCPTEDSCTATYYDGRWHIEKVTP